MNIYTQMNTKAFMVPFVAVLAVFMMGFVAAGNLADLSSVTFNEVELDSGVVNVAGFSGDVVPVRVTFTGSVDAEDVKVRVEIYGGREDFVAKTGRFNVVDGNVYTKLLSLELPSDLDDVTEDLTLRVEILDADHANDDVIETYVVKMQRESYELNVLSVDYTTSVSAGDVLPVLVVVENTGFERADDNYISVSIPELGVSSKAYVGDLIPTEDCTDDCDDEEDSVARTVLLQVPDGAAAGVYELDVRIYNKDTSTTVTNLIKVGGSASTQVLAAVKNQDIKAGETKTYDLIIVNSGDDVKIYNINVVSGSALQVSVPSVVTVGPASSETVEIDVTASSGTDVGSYTFSIDVNGEQVVFGANVTGSAISTSVVALTVVLVIIFVVLLIVLIVLLSRKEKPIEEVETSYY